MANESVSACINFYNDAPALAGCLESASRWADNIFCINSGPGGAYSNDGSIELCEKFGATVVYDDMDKGFGAIRSRLIHDCGCTFAFILDSDERFHPQIEMLHCEGTEAYPQHGTPNLSAHPRGEIINQIAKLRELIADPSIMAIRTTRRHWFDFTHRRPCQNWLHIPDHQLRIIRNIPELGYIGSVKMHERMLDTRTGEEPVHAKQDNYLGLFHDHYHCHYRKNYPGTKQFNEENYQRLDRGESMILK